MSKSYHVINQAGWNRCNLLSSAFKMYIQVLWSDGLGFGDMMTPNWGSGPSAIATDPREKYYTYPATQG